MSVAETHDYSERLADAAPQPIAVTILTSSDARAVGRRFLLRDRLTFGRQEEAEVVIDDRRMSRLHASLEKSAPGVFMLRDEGSRNGSFVEGVRVSSGQVALGGIFRLGDTLLELNHEPQTKPENRAGLIARAPALLAVLDQLERSAGSQMAILLLGETGVGKDVLARFVHAHSGRTGPFVAVNCSAIPKELAESTLFGHRRGAFTGAQNDAPGLFAQARGGTLFLDEIGELPPAEQPKLLRVLETREFQPVGASRAESSDARIIAATNADLRNEITTGRFRADLYARLAGMVARIPPLRERRADILPLARDFFERMAPGRPLALDVRDAERLLLHPWPFNVRELRNVIEQLCVTGTSVEHLLQTESVTPEAQTEPRRTEPEARPSREQLEEALRAEGGNVSRVARRFARHPRQIYRWLEQYGIDAGTFR